MNRMQKRNAIFMCVIAAHVACSGVTDPVGKRGFRVDNTTQDTLLVLALSGTPTTDILVSTVADATPRVVTDSVRLGEVSDGGPGPHLIAPGTTYAISSRDITNYDGSVDLIVLVSRVRRGFLFSANAFVLTPTEVRASDARLTLRAGKYFPTVVP
jgi:hypothetical protein